jgi:hypothetical protein
MMRSAYGERLHRLETQAKELAGTGRYEDSRSIELVFRVRGENGFFFDPSFRSSLDELCAQARKRRQRPIEELSSLEDGVHASEDLAWVTTG